MELSQRRKYFLKCRRHTFYCFASKESQGHQGNEICAALCCSSVSTAHSTANECIEECGNATYLRCLTCPSACKLSGRLQKMSSNPEAQCPDLPVVEELHNSFKRWEQQPGVCSLIAVCIAAAACKAGTSWPLGHLLLLPNGAEVHACHVGAEKPKYFSLWIANNVNIPWLHGGSHC